MCHRRRRGQGRLVCSEENEKPFNVALQKGNQSLLIYSMETIQLSLSKLRLAANALASLRHLWGGISWHVPACPSVSWCVPASHGEATKPPRPSRQREGRGQGTGDREQVRAPCPQAAGSIICSRCRRDRRCTGKVCTGGVFLAFSLTECFQISLLLTSK